MLFEVDGKQTFAYTGGRAPQSGQPTVVFIHGGGLDHTVWILQSRYFAHHGYNVLAIDLPGHGRSQGEPLVTVEKMADWIAQVLNALDTDSAAIVGHSMGSLVALETGARHAQRAWLLALIGTAVPMPVTAQLLEAARDQPHAAFDMINLWGHDLSAQIGGNQAPGMWMTGTAIRLLERGAAGVLFADLSACNDYVDGLQSASRVQCHAHLIVGERDIMASSMNARALQASIDSAEMTLLPKCGHMLLGERPGEVLDALIGSASRHAPS